MASGAKEGRGESGSNARAGPRKAAVGSECPICLGTVKKPAFVAYCMHQFCFRCIRHWAQGREDCPVCRQALEQVLHSVRGDDDYELFVVGLPARLRRRMAMDRARSRCPQRRYDLRRRSWLMATVPTDGSIPFVLLSFNLFFFSKNKIEVNKKNLAAVETRLKQKSQEQTAIDSLQNLVEILQKQLNEERSENHTLKDEIHSLKSALNREHICIIKHNDSLQEKEEKEIVHISQIYPPKELTFMKNCGEYCCSRLRPVIKTPYDYLSHDDTDPQMSSKETLYTATELAQLKKEYRRLPHESETEYVFRVSLSGGDYIHLSEQEASGYWGHGVFLTTGDKRYPWSLTQRAAYWAGRLSFLERGDPIALTGTSDQLLEDIQKAACLQMIHERKLIIGSESPMQLPVKSEIMTPLIRGLPESLKPTAILLQKIIAAISPVERLDRFLGNASEPLSSVDSSPYNISPQQLPSSQSNSPNSDRRVWTWSEVAEELLNYSRKYGPVKSPEEKLEKIKGDYFLLHTLHQKK
ncbi:hypothetical protein TURU_024672 [Turdus rufiventris]|nr:hypothetical protein TURU_024672 [Turdus rufiventris]